MSLRVDTVADAAALVAAAAAVSADRAAAELAAIEAAAAAGGLAGNVRYASAGVTGSSGSGTEASPWSLTNGLTQLQPGDVLVGLGGTYRPYTTHGLVRDVGFNFSSVGTMLKPCTFIGMPGQVVNIEDPIDTSAGWTRVLLEEDGTTAIDPSVEVWESNFTVAGTIDFVTGHFYQDGDWHVIGAGRGATGGGPYTTSANIKALYATSSRFRFDGLFYACPMLFRLGNGKLRCRLQRPPNENHEWGFGNPFFGESTQVYPVSSNPNLIDLKIYRQDDVLFTMSGSYTTVSNVTFNGGVRGAVRMGASGTKLRNCTIRAPYVGIIVGRSDNAVMSDVDISYCVVDGMMDRLKTPITRGDVKSGIELLVNNRSQAVSIASTARNGRIYASQLIRYYDDTVFSSRDWEFGFTPPDEWPLTAVGREAMMLERGNLLLGARDDAIQGYARAIGLNAHHNRVFGAGIGRDGATSSVDWGPRKMAVHSNIFDGANYPMLWERSGRDYEVLQSSRVVRTIAAPVLASDNTITLTSGTALPALAPTRRMTLVKKSDRWQRETVLVTAIDGTGNVLTVTRAQTPTAGTAPDTALALAAGDLLVDNVRDVRFTEEGRCCANVMPVHGEPTLVLTDQILASEWSAAVQDPSGGSGPTPVASAAVYLYIRSEAAPTLPSATATYTFATGALTGHNNGWSQVVPADNGLPLWETQAAATGTGATATIAAARWRTVRQLAGAEGSGKKGGGVLVRMYRRSATTPTQPDTARTYTHSSGALTTGANWSSTIPAGTDPLWVTDAVVKRTPNYRMPWDCCGNTFVTSETLSGQPGGYIPILQYGNNAEDVPFGNPVNLAFNNIIVLGGQRRADQVNPAGGGAVYLAASRIFTGRGDDLHDGNVIVRTCSYTLILIQFMQTSGGIVYTNTITGMAGFRTAELLADARTFGGLADGFESVGLDYQATLASQLDAAYRPLDPRLKTSAFDLTRFNLPWYRYRPWRGALPPLELLA